MKLTGHSSNKLANDLYSSYFSYVDTLPFNTTSNITRMIIFSLQYMAP